MPKRTPHTARVIAAIAMAWAIPAMAAAQSGRIQGIVRDISGQAIKGAIVIASAENSPRQFTAASDAKGRFAMIGLRTIVTWQIVISAPGYFPTESSIFVRSQPVARLTFTMRRDPGPLPGALAKDIQEQLKSANALRDDGRYDQAIAAYQAIQNRNAKLTVVNLVLAGAYRNKARQESDAAARRLLLERAVAAYDELLKDDPERESAKLERAATVLELNALTP